MASLRAGGCGVGKGERVLSRCKTILNSWSPVALEARGDSRAR